MMPEFGLPSRPRQRRMSSTSTSKSRSADLVEVTTSSDDAEESKPAPDIFEAALKKLKIDGSDAVAVGDTPYDVQSGRQQCKLGGQRLHRVDQHENLMSLRERFRDTFAPDSISINKSQVSFAG